MRPRLLLPLLALTISAPLRAVEPNPRDWTRTDTILASAYVAAQLADWGQTRQICRYPGLEESNPALGPHPTAGQINRHFAKTTVCGLAVAYILRKTCPAWVSRAFLSCSIAIEVDCIATNCRNGIHVQYGVKF